MSQVQEVTKNEMINCSNLILTSLDDFITDAVTLSLPSGDVNTITNQIITTISINSNNLIDQSSTNILNNTLHLYGSVLGAFSQQLSTDLSNYISEYFKKSILEKLNDLNYNIRQAVNSTLESNNVQSISIAVSEVITEPLQDLLNLKIKETPSLVVDSTKITIENNIISEITPQLNSISFVIDVDNVSNAISDFTTKIISRKVSPSLFNTNINNLSLEISDNLETVTPSTTIDQISDLAVQMFIKYTGVNMPISLQQNLKSTLISRIKTI